MKVESIYFDFQSFIKIWKTNLTENLSKFMKTDYIQNFISHEIYLKCGGLERSMSNEIQKFTQGSDNSSLCHEVVVRHSRQGKWSI